METSGPTTPANPEQTSGKTEIQQLCEVVCIVPLSALSTEVRELLENVLELQGSVDKSVSWLTSPNNALEGKRPVELIREDNVQRLRDFWAECERRYGY